MAFVKEPLSDDQQQHTCKLLSDLDNALYQIRTLHLPGEKKYQPTGGVSKMVATLLPSFEAIAEAQCSPSNKIKNTPKFQQLFPLEAYPLSFAAAEKVTNLIAILRMYSLLK